MSDSKEIVNSSDIFTNDDFLGSSESAKTESQQKYQGTKIGHYDDELFNQTPKNNDYDEIDLAEKELNEFEQWFSNFKEYNVGELITGNVTNILNNTVYVDISYKAEGIIEPDELSFVPNIKAKDILEIGDEVYVQILKLENKEGNPVLSKKRADYSLAWNKLNEASDNKESIEVYILGRMNDGLLATYDGIRCYIPPTQLVPETKNNLDKAKQTLMEVRVLKADKKRKRVILSQKAIIGEQRKEAKEFVENINIGDKVKGTVSNIKSYGAFINIGPTHGLVHISELSWERVDNVEQVLKIGDEVEATVCGKDEEKVKISLTLKDINKDPWKQIQDRYKLGDIEELTIIRTAPFGAFAELIPGVEGLIHISEFSDQRVQKVTDVVKPGDKVRAMIIRLNEETKKIAFSIRSAQQKNNENNPTVDVDVDNEVSAEISNGIDSTVTESSETAGLTETSES